MKRLTIKYFRFVNADLHSSMDRFEVMSPTISSKIFVHLHSSMDRFEVFELCAQYCPSKIYIPVWIDLKGKLIYMDFLRTLIYIPVWIDLKRQAVPA